MVKLVNHNPFVVMDQEFMDSFFNKKPTDCILYSEDGIPIKIHREILSQTDLMQKILSSAKQSCCQTIEIICPCSKVELEYVMKFLYKGQLNCDSSFDFANILEILSKVFGFPKKFLDEWQDEFEITQEVFDQQNNENTKIFDVDFDMKIEVKLNSIEEGLSPPIIIPLKPKKLKSVDVNQRSRSVHDKNSAPVHQRKKLFKCETCFAKFKQKVCLKRHIRAHHEGAEPFKCKTCDSTFTYKTNLKRHIATRCKGKKHRK